ncbi:hypothetical protein CERSUDRAFT_75227 [Gelatoporia subvermispora B]|uniref:Uncharacterized protein n=1 Tax=Ceriporiopsis subvermispora (strain B) TaxID=914234 RepID=M2QF57_CERS8|nr:hypothetical protein CERSUDRAFT_75227 [Gelatoporia subvermispora B]
MVTDSYKLVAKSLESIVVQLRSSATQCRLRRCGSISLLDAYKSCVGIRHIQLAWYQRIDSDYMLLDVRSSSERKWPWTLPHWSLSLYTFAKSQTEFVDDIPEYAACSFHTSIDESVYEKWMMGARASSIVSDGLVLLLTWMPVQPIKKVSLKEIISLRATIPAVLIRDGGIYFGSEIINAVGLAIGGVDYIQVVSMLLCILTSILMGRFMLDLRRASHGVIPNLTTFTVGSVAFASRPDQGGITTGVSGNSIYE